MQCTSGSVIRPDLGLYPGSATCWPVTLYLSFLWASISLCVKQELQWKLLTMIIGRTKYYNECKIVDMKPNTR